MLGHGIQHEMWRLPPVPNPRCSHRITSLLRVLNATKMSELLRCTTLRFSIAQPQASTPNPTRPQASTHHRPRPQASRHHPTPPQASTHHRPRPQASKHHPARPQASQRHSFLRRLRARLPMCTLKHVRHRNQLTQAGIGSFQASVGARICKK
jgi:hypothetical protein